MLHVGPPADVDTWITKIQTANNWTSSCVTSRPVPDVGASMLMTKESPLSFCSARKCIQHDMLCYVDSLKQEDYNSKSTKYIPGHAFVLQDGVSESIPLHIIPSSGYGSLHVRVRVCVPPPHVTEQESKLSHEPHVVTGNEWVISWNNMTIIHNCLLY